MKWKIPLFKVYWDEDDIASVAKVIRRGTYWTSGPEVEQLETEIANFVGTKYAVSFNSGTSALHADLLAHNLIEGEVINSIISYDVVIGKNVVIKDSIILNNAVVEDNAIIEKSIIGENMVIEKDSKIGNISDEEVTVIA